MPVKKVLFFLVCIEVACLLTSCGLSSSKQSEANDDTSIQQTATFPKPQKKEVREYIKFKDGTKVFLDTVVVDTSAFSALASRETLRDSNVTWVYFSFPAAVGVFLSLISWKIYIIVHYYTVRYTRLNELSHAFVRDLFFSPP